MKRRIRIEIERESDGLGWHAVVWDLSSGRHQSGWTLTRLEAWRRGRRIRRQIEEAQEA